MSIHIYISIYLYVCLHVYIYIYIYLYHMDVQNATPAEMWEAYIYTCMYNICAYIYIYIYAYVTPAEILETLLKRPHAPPPRFVVEASRSSWSQLLWSASSACTSIFMIYLYIYICMYMYLYMYIHISYISYIYIYIIYIYVYIYICIYVCIYIYIYIYIYICIPHLILMHIKLVPAFVQHFYCLHKYVNASYIFIRVCVSVYVCLCARKYMCVGVSAW